jgi:hypothetical protein
VTELVVPSATDAGRIASVINVRSQALHGAVALYERVGMRVVRHRDTWERTA